MQVKGIGESDFLSYLSWEVVLENLKNIRVIPEIRHDRSTARLETGVEMILSEND